MQASQLLRLVRIMGSIEKPHYKKSTTSRIVLGLDLILRYVRYTGGLVDASNFQKKVNSIFLFSGVCFDPWLYIL